MNRLRTLYRWRWPIGWWRLRGHAILKIAGHRLGFAQIAGSDTEWWGLAARRRQWEQPVVTAFAEAIRPGDVVYDVGAWIGPYTLLASKLAGPGGRVLSFEPDPVAREQLERNLALNGARNVTVHPVALSDRTGSARLTGGGSEAVVRDDVGDVEIRSESLADFVAREGTPDVIKIDIEGGELRLDPTVLSRSRRVFLEVHVPAFAAEEVDPDRYLAAVAAGRDVVRLEGEATNFNVRIG